MRVSTILYSFFFIWIVVAVVTGSTGCAQIGAPTGGPRDTIPPRLLRATPPQNSTNFRGNKVTLTFNEYVLLDDIQNNVIISPVQKNNPVIDYKLKTVTVKLKDSLLPNTTYAINFGNAIKDNNEGNPIKNLTYVFSTGNSIDSLQQTGKVIIAETGKTDSSLMAMLYRSTDDSAVQKRKPNYIARVRGDGSFSFNNLSAGNYKIYALKDGDGGKTYNSKTEIFAFADKDIVVGKSNAPITLYASAEEKDTRSLPGVGVPKTPVPKVFRYTTPVTSQEQELPDPLELSFNRSVKKFDPAKIILTDTNYKPVTPVQFSIDSSKKKIILTTTWQEDTKYRLIINNAAVTDSAGNNLPKSDTIRFSSKKTTDYGNIVLRFTNLDLSKHPVLQFVVNNEVISSFPLTASEWSKKVFKPGDYEMRILYDDNNNGQWDPGHYSKKIQPEKAITLPQKLNVKGNWDNEQDVKL